MLKVVGISDDVTLCFHCGRRNLKKTVAILDDEQGEVNYYGTECAANLLSWDKKDVLARARIECKKQEYAFKTLQIEKMQELSKRLEPAREYAERHPEYIEAEALRQSVRSNFSKHVAQYKHVTSIYNRLVDEYCVEHNISKEM